MRGISFVSCGDDDNKKNGPEKVSIIGIWRHDFSSSYIFHVFKKDGTGYLEENERGWWAYNDDDWENVTHWKPLPSIEDLTIKLSP